MLFLLTNIISNINESDEILINKHKTLNYDDFKEYVLVKNYVTAKISEYSNLINPLAKLTCKI